MTEPRKTVTRRRPATSACNLFTRLGVTISFGTDGLELSTVVCGQDPDFRTRSGIACSTSGRISGEQTVTPTAAPAKQQHDDRKEQLRRRLIETPGLLQQLAAGGEALDDASLTRWLAAKGGVVDVAEAAIAAHAKWRASYVPHGRIAEDEITSELAANKVFLQGRDVQGHAVIVVLARRHDTGQRDMAQTERLICYTLDAAGRAADLRDNPLGKVVCLFDLAGLSVRNLDVAGLRTLFDLLSHHYPERLHAFWFLNAPLLFWGLWNVVAPFVDTHTRSKIRFATARPSNVAPALAAAVPPSVLPTEYGGAAALVPIQEAVAATHAEPGGPGAGGDPSAPAPAGAQSGRGQRVRHAVGAQAAAVRGAAAALWGRLQRPLAGVRQAVAASEQLHRLRRLVLQQQPSFALTLQRVPSSREELQVAALRLHGRLLERVLALLVPMQGAWVAIVRALDVAKRALRWTIGSF